LRFHRPHLGGICRDWRPFGKLPSSTSEHPIFPGREMTGRRRYSAADRRQLTLIANECFEPSRRDQCGGHSTRVGRHGAAIALENATVGLNPFRNVHYPL
jgi:hypothetical protein